LQPDLSHLPLAQNDVIRYILDDFPHVFTTKSARPMSQALCATPDAHMCLNLKDVQVWAG
jgi:hypothetical protein